MSTIEAIAVTCQHCAANFRVKPEAAGRSVKCPQCQQRTTVAGGDAAAMRPGLNGASSPALQRDDEFEPRRYPALVQIQGLCRVMVIFLLVSWLMTLAIIFKVTGEDPTNYSVPMLLTTVIHFIFAVLVVALSNFLRLMMDVQENTQRTAWLQERGGARGGAARVQADVAVDPR